jgi:hypothetical protein
VDKLSLIKIKIESKQENSACKGFTVTLKTTEIITKRYLRQDSIYRKHVKKLNLVDNLNNLN